MKVVSKRTSIVPPPRRQRKKTEDPEQIYRRMIEGKDLVGAPDYRSSMDLTEGDVLRHPSFGVGVVSAITGPNKALIVFEDGAKNLVFGKK
jgi:hypothetical protein